MLLLTASMLSRRPTSLCVAFASLWTVPGDLAAEIYVKIPGIEGDVATEGYNNGEWNEFESGSYDIDRDLVEAIKGGTYDRNIGIGKFTTLGLAADLNRALPLLASRAVDGSPLGDVEIHLVEVGEDEKTFLFGTLMLKNAFAFKFTTSGDDEGIPWYQVFLTFDEIESTSFFQPAGGSGENYTTSWNLVTETGDYSEGSGGGGNPNQPPSIGAIPNLQLNEDQSGSVTFSISDSDGPISSLSLDGVSSNAAVITNSGISFSGTSTIRTLTLQPRSNGFGTSTITVTVSDGQANRSQTMELTVVPQPDPPALAPVPTLQTTTSQALTTTVDATDPDQAANTLILTATSSNSTLLKESSIVFNHTGSAWEMELTPGSGQTGTSTVTVTLRDNTDRTVQQSFDFVVSDPTPQGNITLTPATVAENADPSTRIGTLGVDSDFTPTSYSLLENDGGRFNTGPGNGLFAALSLDHEAAATRTVLVQAEDDSGSTLTQEVTITVTNVNEAPTVELALPAIVPATGEVSPMSTPLTDSHIILADPDNPTGDIVLTLTCLHGTLTVDPTLLVTGNVTDNQSAAVTITAPLSEIQTLLAADALEYLPDAFYQGLDTLTAEIDDQGESGEGEPLTDSDSSAFTVRSEDFTNWLSQTFNPSQLSDPTISGLDADADGDGLSTLLEFKLALNPLTADSQGAVEVREVEVDGQTYLEIDFTQRSDATSSDTRLEVEQSTSLTGWNSSDIVLTLISRDPLPGDKERVVYRTVASQADQPRQFLRLNATYFGNAP